MRLLEILSGVYTLDFNVNMNQEISNITNDSREVLENSLFIAIQGYNVDGNKYINSAIEKGAKVIICDKKPQNDIPYVLVKDARVAMSEISANFYNNPSRDVKCIGITGTNGKTTTTYLVKHMLEYFDKKIGLIGTNANFIGNKILETERTTPESIKLQKLILDMKNEECTYAVMEVSSHSLSLDRVNNILFAIGAFTNLSQDHLDFHKTMEEYAEAKAILFKKCKIGVINADDSYYDKMTQDAKCQVISYGIDNETADLSAKNLVLGSDKIQFDVCYKGEILTCLVNIPGRFTVYNALTSIGIMLGLEYKLQDIVTAIGTAEGVKGRVEVVKTNTDYTVLIDYAHSEDGILNVLSSIKGFAKGRVVALFGCGGDRDRTKRPLMAKAAIKYADFTIITSDNPRSENPQDIISDILEGIKDSEASYGVIVDRREAIRYALDHAKPDDIIVLMGKGHETYQEINGVKHHLDEREEIINYFVGEPEKV